MNDAWELAHARRGWRRALMMGLVLGTTGLGAHTMYEVMTANELTALDVATLVLFTVNFAWIATSFWTAVIGMILVAARRDPITLAKVLPDDPTDLVAPLTTRTAVVMPIYHEDVARVFAGLEATWRSLEATGHGASFDTFVLSDSWRPEVAAAEEAAWRALVERTGARGRIHYRRRTKNINRKAGNIQDFCERWGASYACMVVLDADSVMEGELVVRLARAMEEHPRVGILQTLPVATGKETPFARMVQLATRLNGPALATGLAFWQLGEGNYWGHNAIIRVAPFMACCGLPSIPGKPPFGGDILSHDIVEAVLMVRGGWGVWMYPRSITRGSYEEVPTNIIDFASRDRRWCQGNLQHAKLLSTAGLQPLSRLHLAMGMFAYVSPLTWLLLLAISMGKIVAEAITPIEYFRPEPTLFPVWPVSTNTQQFGLYLVSMAILLFPKVGCAFLALIRREERRGFGGALAIAGSVLVELVMSALIAPVMMLFHSTFVVSTLLQSNVSWGGQARSDRGLAWREVWTRHRVHTAVGVIATAVLAVLAPRYLGWMAPVLVGLVLAMPVSWAVSRTRLGHALRRFRLLLTPDETRVPPVLAAMRQHLADAEAHADAPAREHAAHGITAIVLAASTPPPSPAPMPLQYLGPRARRSEQLTASSS